MSLGSSDESDRLDQAFNYKQHAWSRAWSQYPISTHQTLPYFAVSLDIESCKFDAAIVIGLSKARGGVVPHAWGVDSDSYGLVIEADPEYHEKEEQTLPFMFKTAHAGKLLVLPQSQMLCEHPSVERIRIPKSDQTKIKHSLLIGVLCDFESGGVSFYVNDKPILIGSGSGSDLSQYKPFVWPIPNLQKRVFYAYFGGFAALMTGTFVQNWMPPR